MPSVIIFLLKTVAWLTKSLRYSRNLARKQAAHPLISPTVFYSVRSFFYGKMKLIAFQQAASTKAPTATPTTPGKAAPTAPRPSGSVTPTANGDDTMKVNGTTMPPSGGTAASSASTSDTQALRQKLEQTRFGNASDTVMKDETRYVLASIARSAGLILPAVPTSRHSLTLRSSTAMLVKQPRLPACMIRQRRHPSRLLVHALLA